LPAPAAPVAPAASEAEAFPTKSPKTDPEDGPLGGSSSSMSRFAPLDLGVSTSPPKAFVSAAPAAEVPAAIEVAQAPSAAISAPASEDGLKGTADSMQRFAPLDVPAGAELLSQRAPSPREDFPVDLAATAAPTTPTPPAEPVSAAPAASVAELPAPAAPVALAASEAEQASWATKNDTSTDFTSLAASADEPVFGDPADPSAAISSDTFRRFVPLGEESAKPKSDSDTSDSMRRFVQPSFGDAPAPPRKPTPLAKRKVGMPISASDILSGSISQEAPKPSQPEAPKPSQPEALNVAAPKFEAPNLPSQTSAQPVTVPPAATPTAAPAPQTHPTAAAVSPDATVELASKAIEAAPALGLDWLDEPLPPALSGAPLEAAPLVSPNPIKPDQASMAGTDEKLERFVDLVREGSTLVIKLNPDQIRNFRFRFMAGDQELMTMEPGSEERTIAPKQAKPTLEPASQTLEIPVALKPDEPAKPKSTEVQAAPIEKTNAPLAPTADAPIDLPVTKLAVSAQANAPAFSAFSKDGPTVSVGDLYGIGYSADLGDLTPLEGAPLTNVRPDTSVARAMQQAKALAQTELTPLEGLPLPTAPKAATMEQATPPPTAKTAVEPPAATPPAVSAPSMPLAEIVAKPSKPKTFVPDFVQPAAAQPEPTPEPARPPAPKPSVSFSVAEVSEEEVVASPVAMPNLVTAAPPAEKFAVREPHELAEIKAPESVNLSETTIDNPNLVLQDIDSKISSFRTNLDKIRQKTVPSAQEISLASIQRKFLTSIINSVEPVLAPPAAQPVGVAPPTADASVDLMVSEAAPKGKASRLDSAIESWQKMESTDAFTLARRQEMAREAVALGEYLDDPDDASANLSEDAANEKLAQQLVSQGFRDAAREVYEQLKLKNPEKSAYFDGLMRELEQKQS
jgi:hypothetical protein